MKIVIAHLYYDLLNLYGESGNVKALKKYLENQSIEVEIKNVTLFDELHFSDYDCVYIGMGTENNRLVALEHLMQYQEELKNYIENGGFLIATGNSLELFGKSVMDNTGKSIKALDIFPYRTHLLEKRMVCESLLSDPSLDLPIIGFQNRSSAIKGNKHIWMKTIKNYKPENNSEMKEGVLFQNFYGTYLVGPLLVRNPHLLKKIAHALIEKKDANFSFQEIDSSLELKAYELDRKRYEEK